MFSRQTITTDPISVIPTEFNILLVLGWYSYPVAIDITGNAAVLDSTAWHSHTTYTIDATNPELLLIPWIAEATGVIDGNLADLTDSLLLGDVSINLTLATYGFGGAPQVDLAPSWYIREPFKTIFNLPYDAMDDLSPEVSYPYVDAPKNDIESLIIPWGDLEDINSVISSAWDFIPTLDVRKTLSYQEFSDNFEQNIMYPYSAPDTKDLHKDIPWGQFDDNISVSYSYDYYAPDLKDLEKSLPWGTTFDLNIIFGLLYYHPEAKDVFKTIFSGPNWFPKWCEHQHAILYGDVTLNFDPLVDTAYQQYFDSLVLPYHDRWDRGTLPTQLEKLPDTFSRDSRYPSGMTFSGLPIGVGDRELQLRGRTGGKLDVRTGYLEYPIYMNNVTDSYPLVCYDGYRTGPKDSTEDVPYFPVDTISPMIVERVYYLMNTVTLTRVSDSADIPINSLSIRTDLESWAWSFSAEVANLAALELVKPTTGSYVEVEASINGYTWKLYVEGYGKSASFGAGDYTITGRSIAAELAEPYIGKLSYAQGGSESSYAILGNAMLTSAQAIGLNSQWTSSFDLADFPQSSPFYTIKGGHYNFADLTPIEGLKLLAESLGGVVRTAQNSRSVKIHPRYIYSPWGTITPATAIDSDFFFDMSSTWQPSPLYRGVYVSGTTSSGAFVKVIRNATNGAPFLKMVTNELVTDNDVAWELGRNTLAATGTKEEITITMPILPSPAAPGILNVGEFSEITDSVEGTFNAMVTAIDVSASVNGAVVAVRQAATLERHHE